MRRLILAAAVAAVAATGCGEDTPSLAAQDGSLVIRNVTILPMDREEVLPGRTVVIRDGRIVSIDADPDAATAAAAEDTAGDAAEDLAAAEHTAGDTSGNVTVIDGTGRYLMPGLAEMHAHVGDPEVNPRILSLFALNGVTTARGMLGRPAHLALRDSLRRGEVFGPRLITSGPSFSGSGTTPEEARRRVRAQAEAGYDLVKIHPGPSRETFDAIAATAHEVGLPFAGHVPADVGLDRAIEAGYSTIDHMDGLIAALVPADATGVPADPGWFGLNLMPWVDESRVPEVVTRLAMGGIAVVPTQTLMETWADDHTGDELAERFEYAYWFPEQVDQWRRQKNDRLADPATPPASQRARYIRLRRRYIEALHDAGVNVLLGSDAPQMWNVPGFSTHRELHLYVDAGLTPYQALRTGTVNVARHLGEEGASGVVRSGARADLLLLDANPLDDITNTLEIAGVVVNGRWVSGEERVRELEALRIER